MSEWPDVDVPAGTFAWIKQHRRLYLQSGGVKGHVMDLTGAGGRAFGTCCLIRYRGRKSGRTMIQGLSYADVGGEVVICASKGGEPDHPQWYLNIRASETVDFQIGCQAFRATWREPVGAERAKVWDFMVDCHPFYGVYQPRTTRLLPLVMMRAVAAIPVFSESDLD
ncbi:MAG: nitroreductase family deazaflavin-dependent oxidoreductase [Sphingomonadales bacterium]|nr:nitroreductase family deazaflavin-dependent oxidoreductase [Sphingomonadales bacterium]